MSKAATIDIDAFNWVRQGTDTTNSRYCLGGMHFDPHDYSLTATNGVVLLRAELSPNIGEDISNALNEKPTLLLPPSGKIKWEGNVIAKINNENISIFGNNFQISSDRYPNVEHFFNEVPKFENREDMIPYVDPYYLNMFFPKRTKNSLAACDNPPTVKIRKGSLTLYVETYCHGFKAMGFIIGFGKAK